MTLIDSLPQDIIIDCISRLPRRSYPTLSLVSKYFRSLITSHELYARRVLFNRTEYCLYVTLSKSDNNDGDDSRLYTLRQNFNSPDKKYSLVPVASLSRIPPSPSYVAVDSKIFVIPNENLSSPDTLLIDCRFHTVHNVSRFPSELGPGLSFYKYSKFSEPGSVPEMNIGDYEVGSSEKISDGVVMFLNKPHKSVRNQIPQALVFMFEWSYDSAMTKDHVGYNDQNVGDILNSEAWYDNHECFLDGVSYFYSPRLEMLEAFDIRHMDRPIEDVKGVELMTGEDVKLSRTVIYGEKVVVFWQKEFDGKKEIWCAEIKAERDRQEGEFCGRVEWCGCVLEGQWLTLNNSLVVKV